MYYKEIKHFFKLGRVERLIAATSHDSENFTKFINAFAHGKTTMIFGKVTAIAIFNQKLNFVIETADNAKSAREASEERIVALAATGLVFVFGLSISPELKANCKSTFTWPACLQMIKFVQLLNPPPGNQGAFSA
jgi:hypothetical protein